MKIRKLQLKNIGVFDDETIEFQECPEKDKAEIHILTGENGSGKTTILQALASAFLLRPLVTDHKTIYRVGLNTTKNGFSKKIRRHNKAELGISFTESNTTKDFLFFISANEDNQSQKITNLSYQNKVDEKLIFYSIASEQYLLKRMFSFFVAGYSGYRRIKDEKINLFDEVDENPLYQALDFVKDENSKFTVNQWLGRNLSKRALALEDKSENANKFTENVKNLEQAISQIIGYEIRFKLKIDLSLVLIKDNQKLDFDVLPDGLKSLISWIGDLLMRLDSLKWKDDTPIFDREIILFLDEIEVHLHPAWQRKVLPIVQKLFKNAQIFVSTHSPFVVNSVDDAWVYKLKVTDGKAKVESVTKSEDGNSYSYVLEETFDIKEEFGVGVQKDLEKFKDLRNQILSSTNGTSKFEKDIKVLGRKLAEQSEELNTIVQFEIRQINRRKGTKLTI